MIIKGQRVMYEPLWVGMFGVVDGDFATYNPKFSFDLDMEAFYTTYTKISVGVPKRSLLNLAII